MFARVRLISQRHPVLRAAFCWAMPALIVGAILRGLLLSYQPYAYWGSDSNSYYSFAHMLLGRGLISLDEKRRLLYPLLMVPVSLLPGEPLRWVAWCQHALGLATLLPLAYVVRKGFVHWRFWIVPATTIYAGTPLVIWYEHELLGESLFLAAFVWMLGGRFAWVGEIRASRARRLFWWFFGALAVFLLTKPSGRFVWPGICLGLAMVGAWRTLQWQHWAALGALLVASLSIGSKKQGAWLFYAATFPLTRLETPLHAEYKAQIRDLVEPLRRDLHVYYLHDSLAYDFLERPDAHPERSHWRPLARDAKKRTRIYMDLALEGVKARPDLFIMFSLQRAIASANPSAFKEDRFAADYFARRFTHHYEEAAAALEAGKPTAIPMLFNLPRRTRLEPYSTFRERLAPAPESRAATLMMAWVRGFEAVTDVVRWPGKGPGDGPRIWNVYLTPLGWWLTAGALLAFLSLYRGTVGVGMLMAGGYVVGVFLVSLVSPRYFAPALPIMIVLIAVPADVLGRLLVAAVRSRSALAS